MDKTPSPSCFQENREALKVRAFILAAGKAAEEAQSLDKVWPDGKPPPVETSREQEAAWQQCLVAFGHCSSPAMITASHFLNVIEFGFDANKIPYPHKMLRAGYPKPMTWSASVHAINGNDLNFVLAGTIGRVNDPKWAEGAEQELGQGWQMHLATSADELRASMHADNDAFDVTPISWPMFPLNLLAGDVHDRLAKDPHFYQDHRHLRLCMHDDVQGFDVSLEARHSLPENIIAGDICTDAQLRLLEARAKRGPLSKTQLARRTANINPRFFEEVSPTLEKEAALTEMRARWANDKATETREYDLAAEYGAQFVAWSVQGELRWPKLSRVWVRHARWFEMWRRSQKALQADHVSKAAKNKTRSKEVHCANSEASWEALSECSDSSWQIVSELSTQKKKERRALVRLQRKEASERAIEARIKASIARSQQPVRRRRGKQEKEGWAFPFRSPRLREAISVAEDPQRGSEAMDRKGDRKDPVEFFSKADFQELKSFANPPETVKRTLMAVFILLGQEPTGWKDVKSKLSDAKLLSKLEEFNATSVDPATLIQLEPYIRDPCFHPECVSKVSAAAAGFCKWLRGIVDAVNLTQISHQDTKSPQGIECSEFSLVSSIASTTPAISLAYPASISPAINCEHQLVHEEERCV